MNKVTKSISHFLPRVVGAKFFSILFIAAGLCSCDEASVVGLDVQPEGDLLNVGFQDTTTLKTRTMLIDSLQTDESIVTNGTALLGKYIDPIFGEANASLYTQVRLLSNAPDFGTDPQCDSMVLSLRYSNNYYGLNTLKPQTIKVYQVNEVMSGASDYYSNSTLDVLPNDLTVPFSGFTFKPSPSANVIIDGDTLGPQIRVPLENEFGQLILQGGSNLASDAAFRSFMKGLFITTESTSGLNTWDGNIFQLNMVESRMIVYYHNTDSATVSNFSFSLGSVARFNHFSHNFSAVAPELAAQLSATPPENNSMIFLQAMAGLKVKIETPYLKHWTDSGMIAVNKAELVIKAHTAPVSQIKTAQPPLSTYGGYGIPDALVVFGITDAGANTALPDFGEGTNYFGGSYNAQTQEYRFNIARYVQQVLSGERPNNGLFLFPTAGSVNAKRIVIGGGESGPYQMKLNITYTKLN